MQLTGEQRIAAAPQQVWAALNDPAVLSQCIPGCQSLEKEGDDRFAAVAEVRIGPIGARFKGAVTLSDIDAPHGYTITGQGNGGVAGSARGSARVRLRGDGGATVLSYDVDAEVGGRMAQLGGPIIDATARNLAGKFFEKFGAVVAGEAVATPAAAAPGSAGVTAASVMTAPGPAAAPSSSSPATGGGLWGWVAALVMAVLAGFFLGFNAASGGMIAVVLVLLIVVAAAAYQAGQRGGGR